MDDKEKEPQFIPSKFHFAPVTSSPMVMGETGAARPFSRWLRKIFACNPFYLVSAALLLYGLYLISADAHIEWREISRLFFNFGSLQFYELALVVTAIVLARRRIWYDSTLLVGLENLLIFLPFLLLNEAALLGPMQALDAKIVWELCLVGGTAALIRFWGLKQFFKELNLPGRALGFGLLLLVANIALPLLYRHFEDTRLGARPTDGAAFEMNRANWLLLLPAALALVNLLPRPKAQGDLLPQHRWLPAGLFALWLAATGVHVYSLGYVYDIPFQFIFAVPLLWVAAWTVWLRQADVFAQPAPILSRILLVPPALATLLVLLAPGRQVFVILTLLNVTGYALVWLKHRENRTALHLLFISGVALVAGLLQAAPVSPPVPSVEFNPGNWLTLAVASYLLYWALRSRRPLAGLAGAFIAAYAASGLLQHTALAEQLPVQLGFLFLLGHSLRWQDDEHFGAVTVRVFACAGWLLHALFLVHDGWSYTVAIIYGGGGLLLAIGIAAYLLTRERRMLVVVCAASLMLLLQPGDFLVGKVHSLPAGLLAVAGSFLLFALGTALALTRSKWSHAAARG